MLYIERGAYPTVFSSVQRDFLPFGPADHHTWEQPSTQHGSHDLHVAPILVVVHDRRALFYKADAFQEVQKLHPHVVDHLHQEDERMIIERDSISSRFSTYELEDSHICENKNGSLEIL